ERHLAFALVVDVDDHAVASDQQNTSGEDVALAGSAQALFHQRLEFIVSSLQLFGQSFLHFEREPFEDNRGYQQSIQPGEFGFKSFLRRRGARYALASSPPLRSRS